MARKSLIQRDSASLSEKAKKDKELGVGVGRGNKMESTRAAFKAWLLLPRNLVGSPEHVLRLLGITDPDAIELWSIRSQGEFAIKFGVAEPTLSHWKREMQSGDGFKDFRVAMQQLTKNVIGALYRKTIADGDAARVKLWLQVVEGWNETMGRDVTEKPHELSPETKAMLDRLLAKNTR